MDAPGTEARQEHNRSSVFFLVGLGLLLLSFLMAIGIGKTGLDPAHWLVTLGLWVVAPLSVISWILSFRAIRRRPIVAMICVAAAYPIGVALYIMLLVNLGGLQP